MLHQRRSASSAFGTCPAPKDANITLHFRIIEHCWRDSIIGVPILIACSAGDQCEDTHLQLSDTAKACLTDEGVKQAVLEFMQFNDFKGAQV